ncbi:flavodoxin domain-containing protein [Desulfosporosinus nitroreducens]|uniref:flavodoxin domain-containing protein n=1 Tax=Desulfosporosinus nitroreducens TaxID=2018668 RepID=UPI00207C275E|nr:flavodoxin domain-containing protein [Desulfosporosinus nitroreducens]MCO1604694.1 flavodoxin domain-containing protein [Desulfosporosinus nitroreducens]
MKTLVIYNSKTGFTKKYAEWISEELSADIINASKVATNMLSAYDCVIYGGGLYVVGINGVKMITQNVDKLKGKKVVVFATGMSPSRKEAVNEVKKKNFSLEQQKIIQFFYLRGGFDYSKLNPIDKMLMSLLKASIIWKKIRKKKLTSDEIGILEVFNKPTDYTRKAKLDELIAYVTS